MRGKKEGAKARGARLADDAGERRRIFRELLKHIQGGMSLESFPDMSADTVHHYLEAFPEEFCPQEYAKAMRAGRLFWEGLGRRQATGECLGNSRTWFYNMANRFGWRERVDVESTHKGEVGVTVVSYASKALEAPNSAVGAAASDDKAAAPPAAPGPRKADK